jgi:hypothetical protein
VALGHAGCEHVFKVIHDLHDLPVPFRATLPNAAVKYRLSQTGLSLAGGSVGQLPDLQASSNSLKANILAPKLIERDFLHTVEMVVPPGGLVIRFKLVREMKALVRTGEKK